jgi:methylenetetrahydrofolate reductase (NADPH)
MEHEQTGLERQIHSGQPLLLGEISPPQASDPAAVRQVARRGAGKFHAVGVTDNRDRVSMAALAAASLVAAEGVEPILHVVTRDRNRIALVSDALGAQALGIRNLLCTSGRHPTLGPFRSAKSVFDIDPIHLLQTYSGLADNGSLVGEQGIAGAGPFCLGGVASPFADPLELQVARLSKKTSSGAQFLITQPVFDLERFGQWWQEITRRGLHEKAAIVAGIRPLLDANEAEQLAAKRPRPRIPEALLKRLGSGANASAQRAVGIETAVETIGKLGAFKGLHGFQICIDGDVDAALEVVDKAGLGVTK